MKYFHAAPFVEECRFTSEEEFHERHPSLALVLEPVIAGPSEGLHAKARICWANDTKVVLGREGDAQVLLPHAKISRKHVVLTLGNEWTVSDQGSLNGTTVDGHRLRPFEVERLRDGAILVVGDVVRIRAFTSPKSLWKLLRAVAEKPLRMPRYELFERLTSAFRSLGYDAELHENDREIAIADGRTRSRVRLDSGMYVIEWGDLGSSVFLQRRTIAEYDSRAEESVREAVLGAMGLLGSTHPTGHRVRTTPRP